MRIKEIERTANVAWSPVQQYPIYMVAGTAAQQLDATFSTCAALEVYNLDLTDATLDMPLTATLQCDSSTSTVERAESMRGKLSASLMTILLGAMAGILKFHKVAWGQHNIGSDSSMSGIICAGGDNGNLFTYNASALIQGHDNCLLFKQDKHTGAVKALDFNPYQSNLLVSGAAESEILVWDLNKPDSPMSPGTKSQPPEEVACVSWNRQVQHILASTVGAKCIVWDLRKNEPIIKVSDSMSRMKCKVVCWHPEVATQMCISSEDDHTPVIQLWDLRYATSPLRVFENHQRGVLSMAWCPQDADLLLSCGKDNRILCWNPNSTVQGGEVVYELSTNNQWSFDVQWCPRNPSLISSSSFDGHVAIYSLMGGGHPVKPSNKVAESFGNLDSFGQVPVPQVQQEAPSVVTLQKPPKWLRRPVGVHFAFGGKLVTFDTVKPQNPQQPVPRQVFISQVVTETEFLSRSSQLEQALQNSQFVEFCAMKSANSADTMQENIWNFLKTNFESEPRSRFLQLLGFDQTELAKKVTEHTGQAFPRSPGVDAAALAKKMSQLGGGDLLQAGIVSSGQTSPSVSSKTPVDSRDELQDGLSAFDEIASLQHQESDSRPLSPLGIPTSNDSDGLMSQALLTGNFEAAVEMCLHENKMAEAIILAIAGGPELLSRTQQIYFKRNSSNIGRLISSVVNHDFKHIVDTCSLENWKEALVSILTYSTNEDFTVLCDSLASRLESERGGEKSAYASLCYICSGNVEKLVENLLKNTDNNTSPLVLQDLVEKIMVLKKSVEMTRRQSIDIAGGIIAEKLSEYAGILAAQGNLITAFNYLGDSTDVSLGILRDRLYQAIGQQIPGIKAPPFPFQKVSVPAQGGSRQPHPQSVQQKREAMSHPTHQSQAQTNFQTNSVASNYQNSTYNPQPSYNAMNGPSVPNYFTPTPDATPSAAPTGSSAGAQSKGRKYPTYPQNSTGFDTFSTQHNYAPPDFNQTSTYSQEYNYGNYYGSDMTQTGSSPSSNIYNPTNPPAPVGGYPSGTSSATPAAPAVASYQENRPATAWNDPPPIRERKKSGPSTSQYSGPITAPLYGSQTGTNEQPPSGAMNDYGQLYNPQEHKPEIQQPRQVQPTNHVFRGSQNQLPKEKSAAPPPEPVKPIVKSPIPDEHQIVKDIFDNLVQQCIGKATNAQMKRKLEDVAKKLEALYDRLRSSSLSQNVTAGLHQIIQAVQQYDYNTGLMIYTQMVSQANFSEISSFMPGIKMLMQSATQMEVYVQ